VLHQSTGEIAALVGRDSSTRNARKEGFVERFSVYQWFEDDTYEAVRRHVEQAEAVRAAAHYSTSVAARLGFTRRVIITDAGDTIVWEWQFGKGRTWPPMDSEAPTRKEEQR
jgi:hypothetical protein